MSTPNKNNNGNNNDPSLAEKFGGFTVKQRLREELENLLLTPGKDLLVGVGGIAEGIHERFKDKLVPKFRPGGLLIIRAGGTAGLFSAVIAGWAASGPIGSSPVTREVTL